MVSAGGAIGGALVALLAPRIFNAYWEYEIGLIFSYVLMAFLATRNLWRTPAGGADKAGPPVSRKRGQRRVKQCADRGNSPALQAMACVGSGWGEYSSSPRDWAPSAW